MTPTRHQRLKEIVGQALTLPMEERERFLRGVYQEDASLEEEVRSLLTACGEAGGFLETPALPDPLIGSQIGPFRVEERIGEGGMGAVYRAVRIDGAFRMEVAIKVVRQDLDSAGIYKRFRNERQILARLSHPGVARLMDGGVTENGRPYFVMEYVNGKRLNEAAKELGLNEKLDLFRAICRAVHYAHQNLIVHGDLKSSNILVLPDGTPKLLDFGIARLLEAGDSEGHMTLTGFAPAFTPQYASPEQLRGEPLTTASDVYSLGILLCEVLSNRRPYEFTSSTPDSVLRTMHAEKPGRPSELSGDPQLRGDLDNIVLKALQNEPSERYGSAEQMAEDIRRYRVGRPVIAQPDSFRYRASKFVRRNRFAVGAGALAIVAVIGGAGVATWQARSAHLEKERAERRFNDVRRLANAFIFELEQDIATLPGSTGVRGKLIAQAAEYLDHLAQESAGNPDLQAELASAYLKLGDVQGRPGASNLGDTQGAIASYQKALTIRESLAKAEPEFTQAQQDYAEACVRYSSVLKVKGDYQTALELDRKSLAIREGLLRRDPNNPNLIRGVAGSYTALGGSYSQLGQWSEVLTTRTKAYELYEQLAPKGLTEADQRGLALAAIRLASILRHENQKAKALEFDRKALDIYTALLAKHPRDRDARINVANAQDSVGVGMADVGPVSKALPVLQAAIHSFEELVAEDPKEVRSRSLLSTADLHLGDILFHSGEPEQALAPLERSRILREALSRENLLNAGAHGQVAEVYVSLGDVYAQLNQKARAVSYYQRASIITGDLTVRGQANAHINTIAERAKAGAGEMRQLSSAASDKGN